MYPHQDWNVVVLNKKHTKMSVNEALHNGIEVQTTAKTKPNGSTLASINKLDDNLEEFKHKKVPKEVVDKIKNKRVELRMTQADLAKKINVPLSKIQELEAMKSVYDYQLLNKIKRAIGY